MSAGFEPFGNNEQVNFTQPNGLGGQLLIPTEHFGQAFNPNDQTTYDPNSPVAKIYQALRPSIGSIDAHGSTGTGYVVSSDGFMITDHHVATRSTDGTITVTINGKPHTALWVDDANARKVLRDLGAPDDLALFKIAPNYTNETFKPVKFAAPDSLKPNDPTVSLGFPLGSSQLFASPTADLDPLLQDPTRAENTLIRLGDWAHREDVGPRESLDRTVIHTNSEVEHGNSGSVTATINENGEVVVIGTVGMSHLENTVGTETISTPVTPTLAFLRNAGINPDVASNTSLASADVTVRPPARVHYSGNLAELEYQYAADQLFEFS